MPDPKLKIKKSVGRPRDEKSHQAIMQAVLELVAEKGFYGASIEAIARRAGVGKTTIYRHWATKEDLILDVLREQHIEIPIVDTGDFRADCNRFLIDAMNIRSSNPLIIKFFFRLYVEGDAYPQFIQTIFDQLFKERYQHAIDFIEAVKKRGEIRQDIDPMLVLLMAGGPFLYALVLSSMAPGQKQLGELGDPIINTLMEGIQPKQNQPTP